MAARYTCPPCHQIPTILLSFASSRHIYHSTCSLNSNQQRPTKTSPYVSCGIDIYTSSSWDYKIPTYIQYYRAYLLVTPWSPVLLPRRRIVSNFQPLPTTWCSKESAISTMEAWCSPNAGAPLRTPLQLRFLAVINVCILHELQLSNS